MARPFELNGGRPPKLNNEQVVYVRKHIRVKSLRQLAIELNVNHVTIYNSLKRNYAQTIPHRPPDTGTHKGR